MTYNCILQKKVKRCMPFVSRICESIALFSAHKNVFGDARYPYELQLLVNLCNTDDFCRCILKKNIKSL